MSKTPCKNCGRRGSDPAATEAWEKLDAMYSTTARVKNGICPLDGSKAIVKWFRWKGKKVAHRGCLHGHVLPL